MTHDDSSTATSTSSPLAFDVMHDIAHGLAAAEPLWRSVTNHDPDVRGAVRLLATDSYEAWVMSWMPEQRVELHTHGPSAGLIAVVEGELHETRFIGGAVDEQILGVGDTSEVPPGLVHDLVNASDQPATSIHIYSPQLRVVGLWDIDTGKRIADELVPYEPPAVPAGSVPRLTASTAALPAPSRGRATGVDAPAGDRADADAGHQPLLAEQRQALILDEVRRTGAVRVNSLAVRLGVTGMTIRRDLTALAKRGQIRKVHGGAVAVVLEPAPEPQPGLDRSRNRSRGPEGDA